MKYALFICTDPTSEPIDGNPTAWVENWNGRGVRIEGMPLQSPSEGRTIRTRGDQVLVTHPVADAAPDRSRGTDPIADADVEGMTKARPT